MTLGSIVTVINYSNRFLEIAHTFMTSNYNFKEELGEYDQLFSILTMPTPEPSSKPFQFEKEILFADITFAYNPERENILRSLNLSIRPHEWLGIVGASGAGKTTIFDLLLRFYEPQAGSITIDSVPLREISTVSLRSKIAKVSQDTFLLSRHHPGKSAVGKPQRHRRTAQRHPEPGMSEQISDPAAQRFGY